MRTAALLLAVFALTGCSSGPSADAGNDAMDARDAADAPANDGASDATDTSDAIVATPVTITTDHGDVIGQNFGSYSVFRGIPYAAPPVGPLRWRAPQPHDPWTTPLDGTMPPLPCPQLPGSSTAPPIPSSEDCLKLNIWTPSIHPTLGAPTMVFIHGGGFVAGDPSNPLFDGARLAQHGVVVVTIAYRLAQLGFLAHPLLVAEDTAHHSAGNYGMLDQQAAIAWVRQNAQSFGGSADNITIFGESAGAISVCGHVVSPLTTGLFQHAISESGSCMFFQMPLADVAGSPFESAESLGLRFATALGCDTASDVLACLRSKSVDDVLNAVPTHLEDLQSTHAHFMPNVDGYVLPPAPWNTLLTGGGQHVPYLIGVNGDEGTGFTITHPVMTMTDYQNALAALVPNHVSEAVALYPPASYPSINDAFNAFLEDAIFLCPARRVAAVMSTLDPHAYLYEFTRVNNFGRVLGLGAFHGTELPYVFGNFVTPFTETVQDRTLSNTVLQYWVDFAQASDPNGAMLPTWPAYTSAGDMYQNLGDTVMSGTGLHASNCAMADTWVANP